MANISASMVKELREATGAGMMDCKAALTETDGDMEAAVDWLRKKGLSKAAKKAGRVAAEGLIGALVAGGKGVVVEVNSETDFVARNDLFQGLVKMIADVALDVGTDVEAIKAAKVGGITVADAITDTVAKVGENMTLRRAASLAVEAGRGRQLRAQHRQPTGLGKIGVLVALEFARQGRRTRRARPPARHACRLGQSAGGRSVRPRSGGGRAREGRPGRQIPPAGQAGQRDREDRRVPASRPSTRRSACSSSPSSSTTRRRVGAGAEGSRRQGRRRRSRSPASCATPLGEGIERSESDFAAEVAAAAGQG